MSGIENPGVVTAIITSVSAAIVAIFSAFYSNRASKKLTSLQQRLELEKSFDVSLREKRFEAYEELWDVLHHFKEIIHERKEAITDDPPKNDVELLNKSDFSDFQEKMIDWYHGGGGMVLSEKAMQGGYQILKELVKDLKEKAEKSKLEKIDLEHLLQQISEFRTLTTYDLGSRRPLQIVDYDESNKKLECYNCRIKGITKKCHDWELEYHMRIFHNKTFYQNR